MSSGTILLAATLLFTVNYDNMSIATSMLLNENPKSTQFQNLSGHGPSTKLTAKKLPGCQTIGQYEEPHPNVRVAWSTFKDHMNNYTMYQLSPSPTSKAEVWRQLHSYSDLVLLQPCGVLWYRRPAVHHSAGTGLCNHFR